MVALTITLLGSLAACGDDGALQTDQALAEGLWRMTRGWQSWASPEGWEGVQPSSLEADETHGAFTEVRLNDPAYGTLGGDIREGGVLMSVALEADAETVLYWTAMRKIPGYSGDHGDWFWARYAPDGEVQISGTATNCIYCHLNGTDYVYTAWLEPDAD